MKALFIAILLAVVVRILLFAPVVVEGPSMLPTLHNGDHLIVNKVNYMIGEPDRFDIVVFHATADKDYIKRVIGLPGEHVSVSNDQLFIDGEPVDEPFLEERKNGLSNGNVLTRDFTLEGLPGTTEDTIPEGYVLVLGDNRNNSTDSRMLGLIPYEQIVGEAQFVYFPFNRIRYLN
nr:signal peptidase I [Thalassobacillus sp. CUG 92003]